MAALLEQTNQTREKRFELLYTQCQVGIRKRLQFLLHGVSTETLEDLEQITWLKVWNGISDDPAQRLTFLWVSKIATNAVYDYLRHTYFMRQDQKKVARPQFVSLEADWGTYEAMDTRDDVASRVSGRDEAKRALALLPPGARRAFLLRMNGYSYKDILQMTGYQYHNLKDTLARARKKLLVARAREEREVAS